MLLFNRWEGEGLIPVVAAATESGDDGGVTGLDLVLPCFFLALRKEYSIVSMQSADRRLLSSLSFPFLTFFSLMSCHSHRVV